MKFADVVKRSGRNLRSAKVRTILTALAIGVGGFTLTITLAAGNGLRTYTDQLVQNNFDPSELIVGRDAEVANSGAPSQEPKEYDPSVGTLDFGGGGAGGLQVKRVTQADVEDIKALPGIESVREDYQINLRYVTRDGQKKLTLSGAVYNPAQKPEIKAGQVPKDGNIAKGTVLLPDSYVSALGFDSAEQAIGKKVTVNAQKSLTAGDVQALLQSAQSLQDIARAPPQVQEKSLDLTIAGITKKPATSFAFGAQPVLLSNQDGKDLYDFTTKGTDDYQKYLLVYARVADGTDNAKLQAAKQSLESRGYTVQTSKDIQKAITQFVTILQSMVGVFGLITLIASVFGIINTQYISVLERTREIGLMKALGMHSRDVRRLFMVEATWIGFLGGLLGTLGGFFTGVALNPWLTRVLDLGEGNKLFVIMPWQNVVMILALMVVATLAGLLPALKASKMDPIEALRTE